MLRPTMSRWVKGIALAGVAAASLTAVTLPTAPAQAQIVIGAPYYAPYYGYGYGYGYPGVYLGFGGGWHHHHHW
jgi:hypothetical protein